ncbi:MAG TPA: threonine/serine exporter family protein [Chroococcidiopsis sp.]
MFFAALTRLLLDGLLGFVATLGFTLLFNVPRRAVLLCAGIGMVATMLRAGLQNAGVDGHLATFVGALFVGLAGAPVARWQAIPMIVFSITGIITMIPGVSGFQTLVHFSRGDIMAGLQSAVQAGFGVGAIAAGIGAARIITDPEWGIDRD